MLRFRGILPSRSFPLCGLLSINVNNRQKRSACRTAQTLEKVEQSIIGSEPRPCARKRIARWSIAAPPTFKRRLFFNRSSGLYPAEVSSGYCRISGGYPRIPLAIHKRLSRRSDFRKITLLLCVTRCVEIIRKSSLVIFEIKHYSFSLENRFFFFFIEF